VEFMAVGAGVVQFCTAVMHRGFGIIDDLRSGMALYLEEMQMASPLSIVGTTVTPCPPAVGLDQATALANLNGQACTSLGAGAITLDSVVIGANPPGTIPPGCYSSGGAMNITATTNVTLSGAGVYIFRPGGALNTGANSRVLLANGACSGNVFWAPVGAATIGANAALSPTPTFVGSTTCRECHTAAYDKWKGSDHERAMDVATDQTVLGDFSGVTVTNRGKTTRFYKRDGKFLVETEGRLRAAELDHLPEARVLHEEDVLEVVPFHADHERRRPALRHHLHTISLLVERPLRRTARTTTSRATASTSWKTRQSSTRSSQTRTDLPSSPLERYTTAGSSGVPDHLGQRFSHPDSVTATA